MRIITDSTFLVQTDHGSIPLADTAGTPDAIPCQAFLLCDRDATVVLSHPILQTVPSCARCAERLTD